MTYPLDLTKTRLQLQGEHASARHYGVAAEAIPYRGMVRTAVGVGEITALNFIELLLKAEQIDTHKMLTR